MYAVIRVARLVQVQSFKYFWCVVNKKETYGADFESKVMKGKVEKQWVE